MQNFSYPRTKTLRSGDAGRRAVLRVSHECTGRHGRLETGDPPSRLRDGRGAGLGGVRGGLNCLSRSDRTVPPRLTRVDGRGGVTTLRAVRRLWRGATSLRGFSVEDRPEYAYPVPVFVPERGLRPAARNGECELRVEESHV